MWYSFLTFPTGQQFSEILKIIEKICLVHRGVLISFQIFINFHAYFWRGPKISEFSPNIKISFRPTRITPLKHLVDSFQQKNSAEINACDFLIFLIRTYCQTCIVLSITWSTKVFIENWQQTQNGRKWHKRAERNMGIPSFRITHLEKWRRNCRKIDS